MAKKEKTKTSKEVAKTNTPAATEVPVTTPEETVALKAVVNSLEGLSPMALAETVLKIEVKNRKIKNPDMFKVKKA